jgi:excisionase family DNA binding protein
LLTVDEAAQQLRVSPDTIRRFLRDKRLRGVRVGGQWRVPAEAIQEAQSPQMNTNDPSISENLKARILWGREERNLEYKQSMGWGTAETKAKLTKSVLAMSNLRDGGLIIIGVSRQSDDSYEAEGMAKSDFDSFVQDHIAAHINEFADPYVDLVLIKHALDDGRLFCILEVAEFAELPVVCKRDGVEKLRRGATYIRSRRMNETVEVPSQVEMREILDLAIEKRGRAFYTQASRLNFQQPVQTDDASAGRYVAERKTVTVTDILTRVWARPHWRIWIYPKPFMDARFKDLEHCKQFIYRNAVRYLSLMDYPYVNSAAIEEDTSGHWIAGEAELAKHLERWALFRSGQFTHNRALPEIKQLGKNLHFLEVIRVASQVFEFATRMAHEGVLSPEADIVVAVHEVDGFGLVVPDFGGNYHGRTKVISVAKKVNPAELEARNREVALDTALDIYRGFGWMDAPRSLLKQEQERLK